jgi:hypothetical protein
MPPALTPALALDYVRELSADVRAAVLVNAAGELLAGPVELEDPARALLEAGAGAAELEVGSADGVVCAVRSASHAAVAVCGRFAIPGVVREDLRTALAALEGRSRGDDAALVEVTPRPPGAGPTPEPAGETGANAAPAPAHSRESPEKDPLRAAAGALISAAERGFKA